MSSFGRIKKGNIYEDQEFNEQPYTQTDKFEVYVPKQKDIMVDLIQKEKAKQKDEYQRIPSKVSQSQQIQRPGSQQSIRSQQSQQQKQEESQFKQKLQNQVQQGRKMTDSQQFQQQQQNQKVSKSQVNFRPGTTDPSNNYRSVARIGGTSYQKKRWQPKSTGYTQQQETMKKTQNKLRSKLYYDEKTMSVPKTTLKNRIIENIVQEPNVFLENKQLLDSVYKLKQLNLLKNHDIHVQKLPGIGKFDFVYNDFHSKSTNNGFSRNDFGGFYTR